MEQYGDHLVEYLKMRRNRLIDRQLLGTTEFETIVNVAEIEGRKKELSNLISDLEQL